MINYINDEHNIEHVKFVSYTGKYPNLCSGILTLVIDGVQCKFGNSFWNSDNDNEYPSFWSSGGNCGFTNHYADSYVNSGEWVIDEEDLPKQFRKYVKEIDEVFNSNVRYGCCGGCL